MDSLHCFLPTSPFPLKLSWSRREGGAYNYFTHPSRPRDISISTHTDYPALTLVHEVGHFLDHLALNPIKRGFASEHDPRFNPLRQSWRESKWVRSLSGLLPCYPALPTAMKWILLCAFFVTAYLLAFLLLNIRQDRMTVLSDRIKRFQINLLEEYVENKSDLDFGRWRRELEARRPEVRKAIRSSVGRLRKGRQAEVDELIDKSWDEILAVLGGRAENERGSIGLKEIERLLGDALKNRSLVLPASTVVGQAHAAQPQPAPVG